MLKIGLADCPGHSRALAEVKKDEHEQPEFYLNNVQGAFVQTPPPNCGREDRICRAAVVRLYMAVASWSNSDWSTSCRWMRFVAIGCGMATPNGKMQCSVQYHSTTCRSESTEEGDV